LSSFKWPIDKDVSIRQLAPCYDAEVVGDTQNFIHSSDYEGETAHKRPKKHCVYKFAANFPCRNDVTRVLNQLAEKFF
jgi:hypothetical protein